MTIKLGMILLGTLLIYGGWRNLSVQALIFGDNTTPKTSSNWPTSPAPNSPAAAGQSATTSGSPVTSGSATGGGGEPSSAASANAAFGIGSGRVSTPTSAGQ